jgi:hypothetical protein
MKILQSLDDILEPIVLEIVEELETTTEPYNVVIDHWVDAIREAITVATTEYD